MSKFSVTLTAHKYLKLLDPINKTIVQNYWSKIGNIS